MQGKKPKTPKLDQELLLQHLAQELYNEDIASTDSGSSLSNMQVKSKKGSRMDFETYRAKVLELMVLWFKYDNGKAKSGLCDPRQTPTA